MKHAPKSVRAATASLAMLVCLAVFALAFIPFVPMIVFAFAIALLCIGLPVGYIVPGFEKAGPGVLFDLALVGWGLWVILPRCYQVMLDESGSTINAGLVAASAVFAYVAIVCAIWFLLHRSDWLRRFATVSDQPFYSSQRVLESNEALIPNLDRDQCPVCAHRNPIGEMLHTKNYHCRECGVELTVRLGLGLECVTIGGHVALIVMAIGSTQIKLPFYPTLIFLPGFIWIFVCLWIYRAYGVLGLPKPT